MGTFVTNLKYKTAA